MINNNKRLDIEKDIERFNKCQYDSCICSVDIMEKCKYIADNKINIEKELETQKALEKIREANRQKKSEKRGKKLIEESFDELYSNWI